MVVGLAVAAGLGAALIVLLPSGARAFTVEGGEAGSAYEVPQFNLEEQARGFRSDGSAKTPGTSFDTPLGKGTLEFGARQGSGFGFSPGVGPGWATGARPLVTRQDFERMVTPENLR